MSQKKWLISALIVTSLNSTVLDGLFYWFDIYEYPYTACFSYYSYIVFLVLWVNADSKERPQIVRPFDYGLLLYLFWLPYLPYYLWRTRGGLGLLMLAGFLLLFVLGPLTVLGVSIVRGA